MGRHGTSKAIAALTKKITEDKSLQSKLLGTPATVYMRDHVSPSVKQRRQAVLNEFVEVMRALLVADGSMEPDISDDVVQQQLFTVDKIVDYVTMYLHAIGGNAETNVGRIGPRFKIGALQFRTDALWWYTTWLLSDTCTQIYHSWQLKTTATEHWIANEYDLGTEWWPKAYFGMPELWLLFETVLKSPLPASWIKQHYIIWATMLMTGARIGSLCLPEMWENTTMFFKWKDITFRRIPDQSGITLQLNLRWLKGQRQMHSTTKGRKGVTFTIFPPRDRKHACVDLTWLYTTLAIERGVFGNHTLEELETSNDSILAQDPTITDHPVFRGGRIGNLGISTEEVVPLGTSNSVLQSTCLLAGIPVRATSYCFRREALTAFDRNMGRELAKGLATHQPHDIGSFDYYDFGVGDINVTEARLAEFSSSGAARNKLRQYLSSPAINQRKTPFDEIAFKKTLREQLRSNEEWKAVEDSYTSSLQLVRIRFQITEKFPARMIRELNVLSGANDEFGKIDSKEFIDKFADHEGWMDLARQLENGKAAASFLRTVYDARKSLVATISRKLRANALRSWRDDIPITSIQDVTARAIAAKIPAVLREIENPSLSSNINASTGFDLHEDSDNEDDEEYLTEDLGSIDALPDGLEADLMYPNERDHSETGITQKEECTTYLVARSRLLDLWNSLVDFHKGPQPCLLCIVHPWKPSTESFASTFKVDRHVCAPTGVHVPGSGKGAVVEDYARWCELKSGEKSTFPCRVCATIGKQKEYMAYRELSKHLKKAHEEFVASLST